MDVGLTTAPLAPAAGEGVDLFAAQEGQLEGKRVVVQTEEQEPTAIVPAQLSASNDAELHAGDAPNGEEKVTFGINDITSWIAHFNREEIARCLAEFPSIVHLLLARFKLQEMTEQNLAEELSNVFNYVPFLVVAEGALSSAATSEEMAEVVKQRCADIERQLSPVALKEQVLEQAVGDFEASLQKLQGDIVESAFGFRMALEATINGFSQAAAAHALFDQILRRGPQRLEQGMKALEGGNAALPEHCEAVLTLVPPLLHCISCMTREKSRRSGVTEAPQASLPALSAEALSSLLVAVVATSSAVSQEEIAMEMARRFGDLEKGLLAATTDNEDLRTKVDSILEAVRARESDLIKQVPGWRASFQKAEAQAKAA